MFIPCNTTTTTTAANGSATVIYHGAILARQAAGQQAEGKKGVSTWVIGVIVLVTIVVICGFS